MSDIKIIGRAIPQNFGVYKSGINVTPLADGEIVYEFDEDIPPNAEADCSDGS